MRKSETRLHGWMHGSGERNAEHRAFRLSLWAYRCLVRCRRPENSQNLRWCTGDNFVDLKNMSALQNECLLAKSASKQPRTGLGKV